MQVRSLLAVTVATFTGLALLAGPSTAAPVRAEGDVATGTITGRVTEGGGVPTPQARVTAKSFAGGAEVVDTATTDEFGRYTLDVPAGDYLVTLHGSDPAFKVLDSYWKDADRVDQATAVTVAADGTASDVDLPLWGGGFVQGTVTSESPSRINGLVATLYDAQGNAIDQQTLTASSPRFTLGATSNVPSGSYRVGLRNGTLVDQPDAARFEVKVSSDSSYDVGTIDLDGPPTTVPRPTISSANPQVGRPLEASLDGWESDEGVSLRYQWYMNGVAIDAGKQATYTPSPGTLGKKLTVKVTAVRGGEAIATATSVATKAVLIGTIEVVRRPTLAAARYPVVGDRIGRDLGYWKPSGLTWSHQWYRNGSAISGQRGSTYLLRSADWGKKVFLVVKASRTGYRTQAERTESVVVKRAPSMSNTTTVLGGGKVKLTAKVVVVGTSRPSGSVAVLEDDVKIGTIASLTNGVGSLTVSGREPGTHRYTLEYSGNSLVVPASRTREVVVR